MRYKAVPFLVWTSLALALFPVQIPVLAQDNPGSLGVKSLDKGGLVVQEKIGSSGSEYPFLGTEDFPSPLVLARSGPIPLALEAGSETASDFGFAGWTWRMGGLVWHKGFFAVGPDTLGIVIRVVNPLTETIELSTDLLFDLPDADGSLVLGMADSVLDGEKQVPASSLSSLVLFSRDEASTRYQFEKSTSGQELQSLTVANIRRLLRIDEPYTYTESRSYSVLPSSIQDRALVLTFKPLALKPGTQAHYIAFFGLDEALRGKEESLTKTIATELKTLEQKQVQQLNPQKKEDISDLNTLIQKITQAIKGGTSSLEEREKLFEILEELGRNGKNETGQ